MINIRRELAIFIGLLVMMSMVVHFRAWLDHPVQHIMNLSHSSMGVLHPIFLTIGFYLVMAVARSGIYLVRKMLTK